MRLLLTVVVSAILFVSTLDAQTFTEPRQEETPGAAPATATMQKWKNGWDNLTAPLNYTKSTLKWSVATTGKLTVTYTLVGATPNKLYEVGIIAFCETFAGTFGQFPAYYVPPGGGNCTSFTRQNVTKSVAIVEFGVVTTDSSGDGSFEVVVGPIAPGTYDIEFMAQDGAGCFINGGAGNNGCGSDDCNVDFQSPGPFGTATTITIP
jgi:hypothetical protein